jgi:hypothetical protein
MGLEWGNVVKLRRGKVPGCRISMESLEDDINMAKSRCGNDPGSDLVTKKV